MKRKPKSISKLKKDADAVFSKWIRQRDRICITCNSEATQAGHYFSRRYNSIRFDPVNVNGQCMRCNVFLSGNIAVYRMKLVIKHGTEELKRLEDSYLEIKQFTKKELESIIEKYETH